MYKQHKSEDGIHFSIVHFASSGTKIADQVEKVASSVGQCIKVTDLQPRLLKNREQVIQWSSGIIILAEAKLQRNSIIMELVNYAHNSKVKVIAVIVQKHYEPTGALAAIITAHGSVTNLTISGKDWSNELLSMLKSVKSKSAAMPVLDDFDKKLELASKVSGSNTAFLSYQDDAIHTVEIIKSGLLGISIVECKSDQTNSIQIDKCKVFVAILSPKYQESPHSMDDLDFARLKRKEIIPVNSIPKAKRWRASGWLGLSIAGKLYHRLPDKESACKQVYDSSSINDFLFAVKVGFKDHPTEDETEHAEVVALTKQADELKAELTKLGGSWPPPQSQTQLVPEFKHLSVEDSQPKTNSNLPYNYIHYEVTRMSFEPPPTLFDERGVPIECQLDVMFSYQWDIQDMVRDLYQQGRVHNLHAWLDIWGGMQGNVNDSMARAVECSSAILCFFTKRYQESDNCLLELKYALKRDKPIIFILVDSKVTPLDWIKKVMDQSVIIEMSSMSEAGNVDKGIPKIFRIMETIKTVVAHEKIRKRRREDVSEEIYRLECLINDAKDAIHGLKGSKRFSKCTRCQVDFEPDKAEGCTKHAAYYIGGNIMAGRWVCCGQSSTTSPGCESAKHITQVRNWSTIQGGAKKWIPE